MAQNADEVIQMQPLMPEQNQTSNAQTLSTRNPSPSATTCEAYRREPRFARRHPPAARFARQTPPRRSLRSPTPPHRSLRSPPPPPLGLSWRSDPGQMALDVAFEVTPSNSLEGQIEVASSNDLGGRGLERPLMSWPRATSEVAASNDLKWVLEV